jgi:hypothetical protein
MMPKTVKKDHFNYESGQHDAVQYDINFTASKYESPQINEIAKALLTKYVILSDYLNFTSGYSVAQINSLPDYEITTNYANAQ